MKKEYVNRYYLLVRDFSKKYELLNQGVLENSFSIVYGSEYSKVNAVSYDNGTVLATAQYAKSNYADALNEAVKKQSPFGSFDTDVWVIEPNKLPQLKKNK